MNQPRSVRKNPGPGPALAVRLLQLSHHLALLTEPGLVAAALCELLGRIGQAGQPR